MVTRLMLDYKDDPPAPCLHPPLGQLAVDPGPVEAGREPLHLQGAHLGTRTPQVTLAIVIIIILFCFIFSYIFSVMFYTFNTFSVVRKGKVLSLHDTAMLLCFCFCLISQLLCNLAIKSRARSPGLSNSGVDRIGNV